MTLKTNGKAQPWQAQQHRRRARQWHHTEKLEEQQTPYTSRAKPSQRQATRPANRED